MVVQHNITAMNSNRMLGVTTSGQAKSTEKLSSGYKINRAADDAAGLAISEKMRKQIRGLTQASANAQDGISAVQTAEGALGEVQDMLQRMNELAVKAANGTESETDRKSIQNEIDQLTTEIDRVSETTKFNETYLLKGDKDAPKVATYKYGNYADDADVTIKGSGDNYDGVLSDDTTGLTATIEFEAGADMDDQNVLAKALMKQGITIKGTAKYDEATDQATASYSLELNGSAAENFKVVSGANDGEFIIQNLSGEKIANVTAVGSSKEQDLLTGKANAVNPTVQISSVITASAATSATSTTHASALYDRDGNKISENSLNDYYGFDVENDKAIARKDAKDVYDILGNKVDLQNDAAYEDIVSGKQDQTAALNLKLHVGADATSDNQISLNIDAMSAKGLGINGMKIDGTDDTNALNAIETIKAAISKISDQRSSLGAVQNRLEHTIKNLDNVVENTTSAESQIRDTDMATEMVQYSKNNILAQAGQSMLAQANQSNQGVLSLLG